MTYTPIYGLQKLGEFNFIDCIDSEINVNLHWAADEDFDEDLTVVSEIEQQPEAAVAALPPVVVELAPA